MVFSGIGLVVGSHWRQSQLAPLLLIVEIIDIVKEEDKLKNGNYILGSGIR